MSCEHCGSTVRAGALFCGECGGALAQPTEGLVALPVDESEVPTGPVAVLADEFDDFDDRTVVSLRSPHWRLRLVDGSAVGVTATSLIGRNPSAVEAWPGARVIVLDDPAKLMSRSHAALEVDGDGGLWVHDLGSANGVLLTHPGSPSVELFSESAALQQGDQLELGGCLITVEKS